MGVPAIATEAKGHDLAAFLLGGGSGQRCLQKAQTALNEIGSIVGNRAFRLCTAGSGTVGTVWEDGACQASPRFGP